MNLRKIAKRQMRLGVAKRNKAGDIMFWSFKWMRWYKPWPRGLNKPRGAR